MNDLRRTLTENDEFEEFKFKCHECDEVVLEADELTDNNFKNEVLIYHRVSTHAKKTGHVDITGFIQPVAALEAIDATITVNDV